MRTSSRILGIATLLAAPLLALADPAPVSAGDAAPKAQKAERAPCPMACKCPNMTTAKAAPASQNPYWTQQTWKYQ